MEKYITWYRLLLKTWIKKKSSWLQLLILIVLVLFAAQVKLPDIKNTTIGICNCDGAFAEDIMQKLEERESVFTFQRFSDREAMQEAVIRGRLEAGFVFEKGLEENIKNQKKHRDITCMLTPLTTKAEVAGETVYAAFLERYSEELLIRKEQQVFGKNSSDISEMLLKRNEDYLRGDEVFQINFEETAVNQEQKAQNAEIFPVRGLAALLIFVIILLEHGKKFEQRACCVEKALPPGDKACFEWIRYLAGSTIPAAAVLLMMAYIGSWTGILRETAGMFLLVTTSAFWMSFTGRLFRSRTAYASWIMTLAAANLFLCPIFVNVAEYVPAVRYVSCIFPVGIYLKLF